MIAVRLRMLPQWVACLSFIFCTPAIAEQVLFAAAGVKLPITELAHAYERERGVKIQLDFDTAGAAEKKYLSNSSATILITTQERIQKNVAQQQSGLTIDLADTVAGIASSASVKPSIQNIDELRNALLKARSIAFSDPARGATVGTHFAKMIKELGIESEVLAKATLARDGVETMKLVQLKQVELGITQISEIIQADKQLLVGSFPGRYDLFTRYSVFYKNTPDTQAFINYITSPSAQDIFAQHGLRFVKK